MQQSVLCSPHFYFKHAQREVSKVDSMSYAQSLNDSILHMILLERGMVYSSAHTVFTCQILYIRAHFQLGFLPSKQEAARSFPHSLEDPLPLKPTPLPQLTSHSWASPHTSWKESREREREIYWFPGSLISSSRLFWNPYFSSMNSLYGGLS